jgi:bifunctional UDP-N-acetylglucosamine pyrophosphorylase/glucosamine-1-phosphate N-acetyltransferase
MDSGNKIVILVDDDSHQMFPFTETWKCLLPVGESCLLALLLKSVRKYYTDEIIVLSKESITIKEICNEFNTGWLHKETNFLMQIYELTKENSSIAIIQAEVLLNTTDIQAILDNLKEQRKSILCKPYSQYTRSIDTIGIYKTEDNKIENIYMFPRQHYVNRIYCGVSIWDQESIAFLKKTDMGYHNVNCGQMPDQKFYLEEALQNSIEGGNEIHAIESKEAMTLQFPWHIVEINKQYCKRLEHMKNNIVDDSSIVDSSCVINGFVSMGKNSIIREGVIIEGNCWIGDDVIIEKGAILGKNCIINHNSKIQYGCRINDFTVIGSNNKIGFNAEISGVTFDGVCAVHNCEVSGVIGKKVDIAAGVQMAGLRFDDGFATQNINGKKYISASTNTIFIGDYCRTGVNNIFFPGVKVGSRSALGPGVMIEEDMSENTLLIKKQEVIYKSWGSNRYGW